MKRLFTLLLLLGGAGFSAHSQIFWTENFENGSTGGAAASSYVGPNGAWTVTTMGTPGGASNSFYVSCAENGHTNGVCGTGCAPVSSTATLSTLHVGANSSFGGDMGAAYFSGGAGFPFEATTNLRAESPTINCTGKSNITLSFNYIENGDGAIDDAIVWYYDGASWSILVNPNKTSVCGGGQGTWTAFSTLLPTSANNNPSVKIGFQWQNDDDGNGTDPSFAVDSVALRTPAAATPTASLSLAPNDTVCTDSCIVLTSTSTGTVDSIRWAVLPAISSPSMTTNPLTVCFTAMGSYTVTLTAYGGTGSNSTTSTVYIKPKPSPTITKAGHILTAPTGYTSYQWYNGTTAITGATNNTYTYSGTGIYGVVVDSGGCKGMSKNTFNTAGIPVVSSAENHFWVSSESGNMTIYSKELLREAISVTVFDVTGKLVTRTDWAEHTDMVNVVNAPAVPGLYLIRLNDGAGNTITLKYMR